MLKYCYILFLNISYASRNAGYLIDEDKLMVVGVIKIKQANQNHGTIIKGFRFRNECYSYPSCFGVSEKLVENF